MHLFFLDMLYLSMSVSRKQFEYILFLDQTIDNVNIFRPNCVYFFSILHSSKKKEVVQKLNMWNCVQKKGGYKEGRKEAWVMCDNCEKESPRHVAPTAKPVPKKPVDEDLYKISPDLLYPKSKMVPFFFAFFLY